MKASPSKRMRNEQKEKRKEKEEKKRVRVEKPQLAMGARGGRQVLQKWIRGSTFFCQKGNRKRGYKGEMR